MVFDVERRRDRALDVGVFEVGLLTLLVILVIMLVARNVVQGEILAIGENLSPGFAGAGAVILIEAGVIVRAEQGEGPVRADRQDVLGQLVLRDAAGVGQFAL